MSDERRRYPRLNWSVEVKWKRDFLEKEASPISMGQSKDISAGGIRMILREEVAVGDILELEINLGGGKIIITRGRVMWLEPFRIAGGMDRTGFEGGVQFMDLNDETRKEIERFVMESSKG